MRYSGYSAAAAALAMATTVSAHAQVFGIGVGSAEPTDGRKTVIRSPDSNSPVKDLTSTDLICNVNGGVAGTDFVAAAAGDDITFEWYHDNRGDDIIAASHNGPIITWIAEYTEGVPSGAVWSKIAEEGYDGSTWAVENLISNKGKKSVTLPAALKAGKYIVRQEIIALHEGDTSYADNSARGAQFYPSCAQVEVTGSGTAVPDQAFDFNTGYTYSDKGIVFNLYGSYTSYPIPGPDVWTASGSSSGSGSGSGAASSSSAAAPAATSSPAELVVSSSAVAAAPTTLATVVSSAAAPAETQVESAAPAVTSAAAPVETQTQAAPVASATPTSSCSQRRRRRRSAKKNL